MPRRGAPGLRTSRAGGVVGGGRTGRQGGGGGGGRRGGGEVSGRHWGSRAAEAQARRPVLYSALREMPSLIYALKEPGWRDAGAEPGRPAEGGRAQALTDVQQKMAPFPFPSTERLHIAKTKKKKKKIKKRRKCNCVPLPS